MKADFVDGDEETHGLKRHLGATQLTIIGIGAIIGAGIFVITGQAAASYAGPAVVISFIIAALICLFTGLCYAELAALIPISGGSYSYAYVALGEFPAWIVGWTITAQYIGCISAVAVGWSGYFINFLKDFGIEFSSELVNAPLNYEAGMGWTWTGAVLNVPAIALIIFTGIAVSIGIRAAAYFTNLMVVTKVGAIILFVVLGIQFIIPSNWVPFIPENTGTFGQFGWSGIFRGAGLVFFAFIGFDTVAALAQDAKNPQRNLPRGILASLFICTAAYIITSLILTGIANYTLLGVPDPISIALKMMGSQYYWLTFIVKVAILAGLASVVLTVLLGQTRILYAIGKDKLLPSVFARINHRTRTPIFATLAISAASIICAGLFPIQVLGELVSMMTLFLFAVVCLGVLTLRYRHPEYHRPFKVPFVPYVPLAGMIACVAQMCFLPLVTWAQLLIWIGIGLAVYFCYGIRHSRIRKEHSGRQ